MELHQQEARNAPSALEYATLQPQESSSEKGGLKSAQAEDGIGFRFFSWADTTRPGQLVNMTCCDYFVILMLLSSPFVFYLCCSYSVSCLKSWIVLGKTCMRLPVGKLASHPSISYPVLKFLPWRKYLSYCKSNLFFWSNPVVNRLPHCRLPTSMLRRRNASNNNYSTIFPLKHSQEALFIWERYWNIHT